MHSAPSVTYPVGRSRFEGVLLAVLWGLGLLAGGIFWWDSHQGWRAVLLTMLSLIGGAVAVLTWLRSASGLLRWDGAEWTLLASTDELEDARSPKALALEQVSVVLDFQRWLLVDVPRASGRGMRSAGPRLIWLERRLAPADWDDLRRAVYSRARIDALREPEERPRGNVSPS